MAVLLFNAAQVSAAGGGGHRLLMLGDSLTAGYGLAAEEGLPAQLEQALRADGCDVRVINGGVSGDTSAGGLARLDWALADRPTHAVVALGANDALRGLDPARTEANIAAILDRFGREGIPVLLAGMLAPRNLGADYVATFDGLYPRLADRHGTVFHPFLLQGVATVPELNQPDGIHPNAKGVAVVVSRIKASVKVLLDCPG